MKMKHIIKRQTSKIRNCLMLSSFLLGRCGVGLLFAALLVSCDGMNDIHQKYIDAGEQVYLGKTDSVQAFAGEGSVKLTWYATGDPKVETTVIFWNMRKDSIERPFVRKHDGVQKDSVTIYLPEGTYIFELVNKNSRGERSLPVTVQGRSLAAMYGVNGISEKHCVPDGTPVFACASGFYQYRIPNGMQRSAEFAKSLFSKGTLNNKTHRLKTYLDESLTVLFSFFINK